MLKLVRKKKQQTHRCFSTSGVGSSLELARMRREGFCYAKAIAIWINDERQE
jgi:hypothetical protein